MPPARRPSPATDRLYAVRTAHGTTWIVVGPDDTVTAAGRLVAGWTLGRTLDEVRATCRRRSRAESLQLVA